MWWLRRQVCRCKHIRYILWWWRIYIFIINQHCLCIGYFLCSWLLNIPVSLVSIKWSTIKWWHGGLRKWFNVGNRRWRNKHWWKVIRVTQLVIMIKKHYGMLLLLFRCQLRHINHASINIATSIIGGRRWHGIWRIRRSSTGYWRSLKLMRCVRWRSGWLLTNRGQLSWFNEWIIPWGKRRYHRWRQLIAIWVNAIAIKEFFITRTVMSIPGWMLTNRGQLRWIDDQIIQWKRNRYHR